MGDKKTDFDIQAEIASVGRRISKVKEKISAMEEEHKGNESKLTYWAGFDLGYLKGRLSALEDYLDGLVDAQLLLGGSSVHIPAEELRSHFERMGRPQGQTQSSFIRDVVEKAIENGEGLVFLDGKSDMEDGDDFEVVPPSKENRVTLSPVGQITYGIFDEFLACGDDKDVEKVESGLYGGIDDLDDAITFLEDKRIPYSIDRSDGTSTIVFFDHGGNRVPVSSSSCTTVFDLI